MSNKSFRGHGSRAAMMLAVLLSSSWGCATGGSASHAHIPALTATHTATIVVHNRNWADMIMYVVIGNGRYRLGAVETFTTRSFRVPGVIPLPAEVSLFAESRVYGETYNSPSVTIRRGDAIVLTMENQAQFSSLLKR